MSHPLETIHAELVQTIRNAEQLLLLLDGMKAFSQVNPDDIVDNGDSSEKAKYLILETSKNHINLPILTGTLLLYVVGQFEQYIKNQMMAVSEYYAAQCSAFAELPTKMQQNLITLTAEVTLQMHKRQIFA